VEKLQETCNICFVSLVNSHLNQRSKPGNLNITSQAKNTQTEITKRVPTNFPVSS
jgi:hypothetical protein